jgi:glutamate racemase
MDNRPIGIFDSGFGGLTVVKEVMKQLPKESIIYFGDNGRAPYGNKSVETLRKFTFQDVHFLLEQEIKLLVIACNTASASSLDAIVNHFDIPVIEVIESGCRAAFRLPKVKNIGVIGTLATIGSGVYKKKIGEINQSIEVSSKACPLFVPLVEEGWWDNPIAFSIAKEYLDDFKEKKLDALLLGCTHYPLLKEMISRVVGEKVHLISSDVEVAKSVKAYLHKKNAERSYDKQPIYRFYTSDHVEKFKELGRIILDTELEFVEKVDIEKY